MNRRDDFERELGSTLDRMGAEPAPTSLVRRVRSIPDAERGGAPVGGRFRASFGGLTALGATLAVGAVVVGALLVRFSSEPAATSGPQVATPPVASAIAVTATGSGSPATSAPSSPATTEPSPEPSGVPAPATAATPAPTPVAVGGHVPAGFAPSSVTFASLTEGWVVGSAPCGASRCTIVVHTADGGHTWTVRGTVNAAAGGPHGLEKIRFADPLHGWLYASFGQQFWATSDGGRTWTEQPLPPFGPDERIYALEAARGTVYMAGILDGFTVASSVVGTTDWQRAPITMSVGAGPVPGLQLVLSGGAAWVLENDRVVTAGARMAGGTWSSWQPPCLNTNGPATIAASSANDVVAVCNTGIWATPEGIKVYMSHDGGSSFSQVGPALPLTDLDAVATPGPSTIVVGGPAKPGDGASLEASFDGGKTWSAAFRTSAPGVTSDLGFTSASQGVAVMSSNGNVPTSDLLMTRDGGHTWTVVHF